MKLHKLFAAFGLSLFALASVGAGLVLSANDAKDVKADADPTPVANIEQYVDISGVTCLDWFDADCTVQVHMFHSDGTNGHFASDISHIGGKVYKFTLEVGFSRLIVARYNGTWCNQSYDIEYDPAYNLYKIGNLSGEANKFSYTRANMSYVNQSKIVLDVRENYTYWYDASAKTYLYNAFGDSHSVSLLTRVGNNNVFNGAFSDAYSEKFLIVRGNNFTGAASDFTNPDIVYNQTKDVVFTSENLSCRFIALGAQDVYDNNKITIAAFENISAAMYGDAFGYQFLQLPICTDDEGLADGWEDEWDIASTNFNSLKASASSLHSVGLKAYLAALSISDPSLAGQAMKRYDTAIVKNHLELATYDFIGRAPTSVDAPNTLSASDTTTLIATITVVTLVAVSTILIFVVIKKRKYN